MGGCLYCPLQERYLKEAAVQRGDPEAAASRTYQEPGQVLQIANDLCAYPGLTFPLHLPSATQELATVIHKGLRCCAPLPLRLST